MMTTLCHCGSLLTDQQCCQVFFNLNKLPKTAEQLMRSRFTAFKLRKYNYLIKTMVTKPNEKQLKVSDFDDKVHWLGLKVISTNDGNINDLFGTVEFVAFYHPSLNSDTSNVVQLHENSYFKKINNQWLYIKGDSLPAIKLARNEACFCQSGKKYKKCHGV